MPGYVHHDFGDAIRTIANPTKEDETNLDRVKFDEVLFEGFARGFLGEPKRILNREEIATLAFSARFMTFMIGFRFLTDHIVGDTYYRIHHRRHNLHRARAQFKLLASMEEQAEVMEDIIETVVMGE
jgi:hypothetical protein